MKIKEVEIIGFKSFAEKTTLFFQPRIIAVVGPNGCGKSNVVDSLRWALGEQSAKQLRGALMEDVIFNGSEQKKPIGMAEVSLIFSNDDGAFPPYYNEFSEVQVTRRLFRSGESEYSINKVPCRLKDISELFMDTGVGNKTYSIIEQGKVEMILNSKPQERRFLIEEAAGITKYKSRKKEAFAKIESTKQNLLRLSDIIGEIKRQMNTLNRQVKKAKRYSLIQEEIKEKELRLASIDYKELLERKKDKKNSVGLYSKRDAEISAHVQENEIQLEKLRIKLLQKEEELNTDQKRVLNTNASIQKHESRIEYGNKELEMLEKQHVRLADDIKKLQSQVEASAHETRELEKEEREVLSLLRTDKSKLEEMEKSFKRQDRDYEAAVKRIEAQKTLLIDVLTNSTTLKNSIAHLKTQHADFLRREKKNNEEMTQAKKMIGSLEVKASTLKNDHAQFKSIKSRLEKEKEKKIEALKSFKQVAEDTGKIVENLKEKLHKETARFHSLKELQKSYEGYQEGVRSILLQYQEGEGKGNGIYGVVADIIETEPPYETALEAVLGEKLQYIVVKSQHEGVEAIEYLKAQSAGRGSFIPLQLRKETPFFENASRHMTHCTPLMNLVKVKEGFYDVAQYLLSHVLVVEDLRKAMELWRHNGCVGTMVTLDGDLIDQKGVLTGGSKETIKDGFLKKKREFSEIHNAILGTKKSFEKAVKEHNHALSELASLQEHVEKLGKQLYDQDVKILSIEGELAQVYSELNWLQERIEIVRFENDQLLVDKKETKGYLADKTKKLQEILVLKDSKEKVLQDVQDEERQLKQEMHEIRSELTDSKVRISSFKEKLESISFRVNRFKKTQEEGCKDIEEKKTETKENSRESLEISQMVENSQNAMKELQKCHKDLQDSLAEKRAEIESDKKMIMTKEDAKKALFKEQEENHRQSAALNIELTETCLNISHLEDRIQEKYHVELKKWNVCAPKGFSREEMNMKLVGLKESLASIGEVNLTAIRENERLKERYEFLTVQQDDLVQSLESLHKAINMINRTTRTKFNDSFLAINERFKETFSHLFKGGRAELLLTDEKDLLETGIEIVAQPPGKRLQSISLLSGGEKALTTLALIFSIFAIKPSPFCILDEVDAALDDANIDRFNTLLLEMSQKSQFILVTHNKHTMEIADTLIGVTMEEPGISKLVSVKMNASNEAYVPLQKNLRKLKGALPL